MEFELAKKVDLDSLDEEINKKVSSVGANLVEHVAVINKEEDTTGIPNNTLILELE